MNACLVDLLTILLDCVVGILREFLLRYGAKATTINKAGDINILQAAQPPKASGHTFGGYFRAECLCHVIGVLVRVSVVCHCY